jgi:hypothetical protein
VSTETAVKVVKNIRTQGDRELEKLNHAPLTTTLSELPRARKPDSVVCHFEILRTYVFTVSARLLRMEEDD